MQWNKLKRQNKNQLHKKFVIKKDQRGGGGKVTDGSRTVTRKIGKKYEKLHKPRGREGNVGKKKQGERKTRNGTNRRESARGGKQKMEKITENRSRARIAKVGEKGGNPKRVKEKRGVERLSEKAKGGWKKRIQIGHRKGL